MFCGTAQKHPCRRPSGTLHGVVFDILVGSETSPPSPRLRRDSLRSLRLTFVALARPAEAREASEGWWARQDSNLQPDRYERPALTIELQAPPRSGRGARPATVPPSFTGMTAIRQCRVGAQEQAFIRLRACLQPPLHHSSPNA